MDKTGNIFYIVIFRWTAPNKCYMTERDCFDGLLQHLWAPELVSIHSSVPQEVRSHARANLISQVHAQGSSSTRSSAHTCVQAPGLREFQIKHFSFLTFSPFAIPCSIRFRRLHARPKGYILSMNTPLEDRTLILSCSKPQNHLERFLLSSPKFLFCCHEVLSFGVYSSTYPKQIHLKEAFKVVGSYTVKVYGEQPTRQRSPSVELQLEMIVSFLVAIGYDCEFSCNFQIIQSLVVCWPRR